MEKSGCPLRTFCPTKSTKILSTKPSTFTLICRTRVGSTCTRAGVRQEEPTAPLVTVAVRRPMSCWREGSMVTAAMPGTLGPPAWVSSLVDRDVIHAHLVLARSRRGLLRIHGRAVERDLAFAGLGGFVRSRGRDLDQLHSADGAIGRVVRGDGRMHGALVERLLRRRGRRAFAVLVLVGKVHSARTEQAAHGHGNQNQPKATLALGDGWRLGFVAFFVHDCFHI